MLYMEFSYVLLNLQAGKPPEKTLPQALFHKSAMCKNSPDPSARQNKHEDNASVLPGTCKHYLCDVKGITKNTNNTHRHTFVYLSPLNI